MSVKDMYSPNIQNSNLGDKLSDSILGTNRVHNINMSNNYELQKAVNVNKFNWNKQGMISAGINPLAAASQLGGVSNSQAQSSQSTDTFIGDYILETVKDMLDSVNPVKQLKEFKKLVQSKL